MSRTLKLINIILAIALVMCLLPMPYAYFTLVRFASMVIFVYMAYQYYDNGNTSLTWVFGSLAVLFQPLIKISLGRELWNIVDVIVAIFIIVNVIRNK